jgi:hypothetical protein
MKKIFIPLITVVLLLVAFAACTPVAPAAAPTAAPTTPKADSIPEITIDAVGKGTIPVFS